MKFTPSLVITLLLTLSALAEAKDQVANSVVKIHVTSRQPDFVRPWNKGNPEESSGSGAIIEGNRILTNAHVVLYASQIFVQADQTTERVPAKVVAIAPGLDLAVLRVEKPAFFEGRPPLPLADDIPAVKQTVSVYGYPIGGEQISVTQGIVSRIECTTIYCLVRGLRIQIDAALNPGNSGGPAVADGKIVGLVHSKLSKGENIGYLIAAGEIQRFLKDSQAWGLPGQTADLGLPGIDRERGPAGQARHGQRNRDAGDLSVQLGGRLSLEAMGRDHARRRPAGGQSGQREDQGRSAGVLPISCAQAGQ